MISEFLIGNVMFTKTLREDLYIITINGIFVWKGYDTDDIFRLNIDTNKIYLFIYMLCILIFDMFDFVM